MRAGGEPPAACKLPGGAWTPGHRIRATCTLRYAGRTTTATISSRRPSTKAPPAWWWNAPTRHCPASWWCRIRCALCRSWARGRVRRWGGQVIGVTGSAGKTTTKDAIAHLLAAELPVGKTIGNFNNHVGVPLSHSAAAGRLPRRRARNGHESRGRNPRTGRHRQARHRRGDQRRLRARGVLRFHRRRGRGQARVDRSAAARWRRGAECRRSARARASAKCIPAAR